MITVADGDDDKARFFIDEMKTTINMTPEWRWRQKYTFCRCNYNFTSQLTGVLYQSRMMESHCYMLLCLKNACKEQLDMMTGTSSLVAAITEHWLCGTSSQNYCMDDLCIFVTYVLRYCTCRLHTCCCCSAGCANGPFWGGVNL